MTLTRGARITGAVLCAVLALSVGAWIVRDLTTAAAPLDLWRFWTGSGRSPSVAPLTTTLEDLVLFVVYVAVAVAALRSPVAAAALVAAGVVTLAVRLPGLWVLTASWMDLRATDELRTRALYCAFAALGLGIGLLITAVAGRRPPGVPYGTDDPYATHAAYGRPEAYAAHDQTPTRPARGVGVLAFLLLGASAGILVAWEIHLAAELDGRVLLERFTGGESVYLPLLGTPEGWLSAVVVVLGLVAAVGALWHAVFARPLGLVVAVFLVGSGARGLDIAVRNELFSRFGDLATRDQLLVGTWLFDLAAGAVLLLALLRRGASDPSDGGAPDRQQQSRAGYGYPQDGGGFGPPPPSSPPPGW
ncbi:hypothetical protein OG883_04465 [Streptomyces sp. NBC_01142]|uniref:hypothetical protein n=1 Tax=Streptomyces sp. NBC_01142 TaxID=2975865 RepID=UPI00225BB0D1|nr:hypothetical protein [Streptomyces sp. NBC_01142]MCX4819168.1 hypothetical protein [Streptomyces sp. NBC_01142]